MNIIIDDTLIFYDEDEQSSNPPATQSSLAIRSAQWFIELGSKIFKRIDKRANAALERQLEDKPDLEEADAYFVQIGSAFEPKPFGVDQISKRIPYANPITLACQLDAAAKRGWLEKMGGHKYFVSGRGGCLRDKMVATAKETYRDLESLPTRELKRIDDLLGFVVDAAIDGDLPDDKSALLWSRKFESRKDNLPIERVRRRIADLFAFRDDAHISAWRLHEDQGYIWEAFTYVWNDDANTAAELAERLSHRGFTESDYSSALKELVTRGWLIELPSLFKATPAGRALREAVEEQTNQYYDASWGSLTESEYEELGEVLKKLADALRVEKVIN